MDKFEKQLKFLIEEIKKMGIKDKKVLDAISKIPRHEFVLDNYKEEAYENRPLPILAEQTISQPYTVAVMLEALELKEGDKVLEIGSGSGWNAALISEIIKPGIVYSTEIIPELAEFAKKNIKKMSIKNVKIIETDGSKGYKEKMPYDKIIVTAAAPELSRVWLKQLKNNGILVAPIGPLYGQEMLKVVKNKDKLEIKNLGNFIFVPLKSK